MNKDTIINIITEATPFFGAILIFASAFLPWVIRHEHFAMTSIETETQRFIPLWVGATLIVASSIKNPIVHVSLGGFSVFYIQSYFAMKQKDIVNILLYTPQDSFEFPAIGFYVFVIGVVLSLVGGIIFTRQRFLLRKRAQSQHDMKVPEIIAVVAVLFIVFVSVCIAISIEPLTIRVSDSRVIALLFNMLIANFCGAFVGALLPVVFVRKGGIEFSRFELITNIGAVLMFCGIFVVAPQSEVLGSDGGFNISLGPFICSFFLISLGAFFISMGKCLARNMSAPP